MQIQIRKDCSNRKLGLCSSGCDYCEGGFIYEWVDLASAILEILKSGQSPNLGSFMQNLRVGSE